MSYLFPQGSNSALGVLQVGSNISVDANSIISIPQSVASNSNVTFNYLTTTVDINANGNIFGSAIFDSNNRVITKLTPTASNGISITSVTSNGPNAAFTVTNTGVLNLTAGTGINVSASTGNITISSTGTSIINTTGQSANYTITSTDDYIGVTGVSPTTVTLPAGITGTSYIIKNEKTNSSRATVACTGSDTIDGSNTKDLSQNASLTVVYRAGVWRII